MFGLSTTEMLTKTILNASQNLVFQYKQEIRDNIEQIKELSENDANEIFVQIRMNYLNLVSNSVISVFQASSP